VLNEDTQVDLFLPFFSKQKPAVTKHIWLILVIWYGLK
jgi:hypothetical protein